MRTIAALAVTAIIAAAVPALAQSDSTAAPAVARPSDTAKTTAAPVAGKNSFTESEVKKRLEDHGYSQVSDLMKDDQSIWRGKAMKAGARVTVSVDYQGNITDQ